ncbi:MAG: SPOR domain-containing protein [Thermodesulfobacteriota bacterium]
MSTSMGCAKGAVVILTVVFILICCLPAGRVAAQQPSDAERIIKRVKIKPPAEGVKRKVTKAPQAGKAEKAPPPKKMVEKKPVVKTPRKATPKEKPRKPSPVPARKKEEKRVALEVKEPERLWAIHVASYVSKEQAESIARTLRSAGYNAYMVEFDFRGVHWHRLRVGFYTTEDEAKRHAQELTQRFDIEGPWIVKPSRKEVMSHRK